MLWTLEFWGLGRGALGFMVLDLGVWAEGLLGLGFLRPMVLLFELLL